MGMIFFGNALLLLGSLALEMGLFNDGGDSGSDDTSAATDTPADDPTVGDGPLSNPLDYIPENYAAENTGTDGADDLEDDDADGEAWFLGDGDDTLDAGNGDDFVLAGDGNDDVLLRLGDDIALGGEGDDTIDAGFGDDTVSGGFGDDQINGSKGDDWLLGDLGDDLLTGSDGDDSLQGDAGNDTLYGNFANDPGATDDGNDTLDGGEGDDLLAVAGGDQATGGAGADSFQIHDPGDSGLLATITDFDAAEDVVALVYTPAVDPVSGDPVTPVVTVTPNGAGTAATVTVDGVDVALVTGGQSLTAADIGLIPDNG